MTQLDAPSFYRLFGNISITSGVREFADRHECHWWVTDLAAYSLDIEANFQVWQLEVQGSYGRMSCVSDAGQPPLKVVDRILTDMVEGVHSLWLIRNPGVRDLILLPDEY